MPMPDVVIAGAGLIGLACALECERRGLRVTVLERGVAVRQASWAAAGMLAVHDSANPVALRPLSELSIALYPQFLADLHERSSITVPMETDWVLEAGGTGPSDALPQGFHGRDFTFAREQSLNPRKLICAVYSATKTSSIDLREHTPVERFNTSSSGALIQTPHATIACGTYLDCTGAWSAGRTHPAKGQMLRVFAPGALAVKARGNVVVRTDDIYMVPRLDGSVVIGATVEDAGYDTSLHDADLNGLRLRAASLLPSLAHAPEIERWSGLRPDTPDHLPFLGETGERTFVAAGHFRNGVLLAPATALIMTELLLGETPSVALEPFNPQRFTAGQRRHERGAVFEHA